MSKPTEEVIDYSNFSSIVTGEGDWLPAGFPQADGSFWQYQEPNAVVIVQDGYLRVAAVRYTRHHDRQQILDNAKHMYFSARQFAPPPIAAASRSARAVASMNDCDELPASTSSRFPATKSASPITSTDGM
jgi:uncharacterized protein DUF6081